MSDDIAPEPYRTEIAKYLHRSFHDEHGPSFWEGYTGHADDLWRIANPTLSTTNPPPPADDLVERLRARLCACPGDDEMIAAVDTILSLRQKLEETEASWEKSRDLVTEQYRQKDTPDAS